MDLFTLPNKGVLNVVGRIPTIESSDFMLISGVHLLHHCMDWVENKPQCGIQSWGLHSSHRTPIFPQSYLPSEGTCNSALGRPARPFTRQLLT